MTLRPMQLTLLLLAVCAAPAAAQGAGTATTAGTEHYGRQPWRPRPYPRTYTSPLWGRHGELWTPAGRLADWSDAGYGGEGRPTPPWYPAPRAFSITRFGARPTPGFGALQWARLCGLQSSQGWMRGS